MESEVKSSVPSSKAFTISLSSIKPFPDISVSATRSLFSWLHTELLNHSQDRSSLEALGKAKGVVPALFSFPHTSMNSAHVSGTWTPAASNNDLL